MRVFKTILITLSSVIGLIGIILGIMFLTGSFNIRTILPEDIAFEYSEMLTDSDFNVRVFSNTESVTEKNVILTLGEDEQLISGEIDYITDGIIKVPRVVALNQYFKVKMNKDTEGNNIGGVSNIIATSDNVLIRPSHPLTVYVDVPVNSITVEIYDSQGNLVVNSESEESGSPSQLSATPFNSSSSIVLTVGSVYNLKAKFMPTQSAKNAYGQNRDVVFEIPNQFREYMNFYNNNNNQIHILKALDNSIGLNAYCYQTTKAENQNAGLNLTYEEKIAAMISTGVASNPSSVISENVKVTEFESIFTSLGLSYSFYVNTPIRLYANKSTGLLENEFNLGLSIKKSSGDEIQDRLRHVELNIGIIVNSEGDFTLELTDNVYINEKFSNGSKAVINNTNINHSYWEVVFSDEGEYFIIAQLDEYSDFEGENSEIIWDQISVDSEVSSISWQDINTVNYLTILDAEKGKDIINPTYSLAEKIKFNGPSSYKTVKYFAYTNSNNDLTSYLDCVYYGEVNGKKYYEIPSGLFTAIEDIPSVQVVAVVVKADYFGIIDYDNENKYKIFQTSNVMNFQILKSLKSLIINEFNTENEDIIQENTYEKLLVISYNDKDIFDREYAAGNIEIAFYVAGQKTNLMLFELDNTDTSSAQFNIYVQSLPNNTEVEGVIKINYLTDPRLNLESNPITIKNGFPTGIEFNEETSENTPINISYESEGGTLKIISKLNNKDINIENINVTVSPETTQFGTYYFIYYVKNNDINAVYEQVTPQTSPAYFNESGGFYKLSIRGSNEDKKVKIVVKTDYGDISDELFLVINSYGELSLKLNDSPVSETSQLEFMGYKYNSINLSDKFKLFINKEGDEGPIDLTSDLDFELLNNLGGKIEYKVEVGTENKKIVINSNFSIGASTHLRIFTNYGFSYTIPIEILGCVEYNAPIVQDDEGLVDPTAIAVYAMNNKTVDFTVKKFDLDFDPPYYLGEITQSGKFTALINGTLYEDYSDYCEISNKKDNSFDIKFEDVASVTTIVLTWQENSDDPYAFKYSFTFKVHPNVQLVFNDTGAGSTEDNPFEYATGSTYLINDTNSVLKLKRILGTKPFSDGIITAYYEGVELNNYKININSNFLVDCVAFTFHVEYAGYSLEQTVWLKPKIDGLDTFLNNHIRLYNGINYFMFDNFNESGKTITPALNGVEVSVESNSTKYLRINENDIAKITNNHLLGNIITTNKLVFKNLNGTIKVPVLIIPIQWEFVRYDGYDQDEYEEDISVIINTMYDTIESGSTVVLSNKIIFDGTKTYTILNLDGTLNDYVTISGDSESGYTLTARFVGEDKFVKINVRCNFGEVSYNFDYRLKILKGQEIHTYYPYEETGGEDYIEYLTFSTPEIELNMLSDFGSDIPNNLNNSRVVFKEGSSYFKPSTSQVNFSVSYLEVDGMKSTAYSTYITINSAGVITFKKGILTDSLYAEITASSHSGATAVYRIVVLVNPNIIQVRFTGNESAWGNLPAEVEISDSDLEEQEYDLKKHISVYSTLDNVLLNSDLYEFYVEGDGYIDEKEGYDGILSISSVATLSSAKVYIFVKTGKINNFGGLIASFTFKVSTTIEYVVFINEISGGGTLDITEAIKFYNYGDKKNYSYDYQDISLWIDNPKTLLGGYSIKDSHEYDRYILITEVTNKELLINSGSLKIKTESINISSETFSLGGKEYTIEVEPFIFHYKLGNDDYYEVKNQINLKNNGVVCFTYYADYSDTDFEVMYVENNISTSSSEYILIDYSTTSIMLNGQVCSINSGLDEVSYDYIIYNDKKYVVGDDGKVSITSGIKTTHYYETRYLKRTYSGRSGSTNLPYAVATAKYDDIKSKWYIDFADVLSFSTHYISGGTAPSTSPITAAEIQKSLKIYHNENLLDFDGTRFYLGENFKAGNDYELTIKDIDDEFEIAHLNLKIIYTIKKEFLSTTLKGYTGDITFDGDKIKIYKYNEEGELDSYYEIIYIDDKYYVATETSDVSGLGLGNILSAFIEELKYVGMLPAEFTIWNDNNFVIFELKKVDNKAVVKSDIELSADFSVKIPFNQWITWFAGDNIGDYADYTAFLSDYYIDGLTGGDISPEGIITVSLYSLEISIKKEGSGPITKTIKFNSIVKADYNFLLGGYDGTIYTKSGEDYTEFNNEIEFFNELIELYKKDGDNYIKLCSFYVVLKDDIATAFNSKIYYNNNNLITDDKHYVIVPINSIVMSVTTSNDYKFIMFDGVSDGKLYWYEAVYKPSVIYKKTSNLLENIVVETATDYESYLVNYEKPKFSAGYSFNDTDSKVTITNTISATGKGEGENKKLDKSHTENIELTFAQWITLLGLDYTDYNSYLADYEYPEFSATYSLDDTDNKITITNTISATGKGEREGKSYLWDIEFTFAEWIALLDLEYTDYNNYLADYEEPEFSAGYSFNDTDSKVTITNTISATGKGKREDKSYLWDIELTFAQWITLLGLEYTDYNSYLADYEYPEFSATYSLDDTDNKITITNTISATGKGEGENKKLDKSYTENIELTFAQWIVFLGLKYTDSNFTYRAGTISSGNWKSFISVYKGLSDKQFDLFNYTTSTGSIVTSNNNLINAELGTITISAAMNKSGSYQLRDLIFAEWIALLGLEYEDYESYLEDYQVPVFSAAYSLDDTDSKVTITNTISATGKGEREGKSYLWDIEFTFAQWIALLGIEEDTFENYSDFDTFITTFNVTFGINESDFGYIISLESGDVEFDYEISLSLTKESVQIGSFTAVRGDGVDAPENTIEITNNNLKVYYNFEKSSTANNILPQFVPDKDNSSFKYKIYRVEEGGLVPLQSGSIDEVDEVDEVFINYTNDSSFVPFANMWLRVEVWQCDIFIGYYEMYIQDSGDDVETIGEYDPIIKSPDFNPYNVAGRTLESSDEENENSSEGEYKIRYKQVNDEGGIYNTKIKVKPTDWNPDFGDFVEDFSIEEEEEEDNKYTFSSTNTQYSGEVICDVIFNGNDHYEVKFNLTINPNITIVGNGIVSGQDVIAGEDLTVNIGDLFTDANSTNEKNALLDYKYTTSVTVGGTYIELTDGEILYDKTTGDFTIQSKEVPNRTLIRIRVTLTSGEGEGAFIISNIYEFYLMPSIELKVNDAYTEFGSMEALYYEEVRGHEASGGNNAVESMEFYLFGTSLSAGKEKNIFGIDRITITNKSINSINYSNFTITSSNTALISVDNLKLKIGNVNLSQNTTVGLKVSYKGIELFTYNVRLFVNPVFEIEMNQTTPNHYQDGVEIIPTTGDPEGLKIFDSEHNRLNIYYNGMIVNLVKYSDIYDKFTVSKVEQDGKKIEIEIGIEGEGEDEERFPYLSEFNLDVSGAYQYVISFNSPYNMLLGTQYFVNTLWDYKIEPTLTKVDYEDTTGEEIDFIPVYLVYGGTEPILSEVFGVSKLFSDELVSSIKCNLTLYGKSTNPEPYIYASKIDDSEDYKLVVDGAPNDGVLVTLNIEFFGNTNVTKTYNIWVLPGREFVYNYTNPEYIDGEQYEVIASSGNPYDFIISTNPLIPRIRIRQGGQLLLPDKYTLSYSVSSDSDPYYDNEKLDFNDEYKITFNSPLFKDKYVFVKIKDEFGLTLIYRFVLKASQPVEVVDIPEYWADGEDKIDWDTDKFPFILRDASGDLVGTSIYSVKKPTGISVDTSNDDIYKSANDDIYKSALRYDTDSGKFNGVTVNTPININGTCNLIPVNVDEEGSASIGFTNWKSLATGITFSGTISDNYTFKLFEGVTDISTRFNNNGNLTLIEGDLNKFLTIKIYNKAPSTLLETVDFMATKIGEDSSVENKTGVMVTSCTDNLSESGLQYNLINNKFTGVTVNTPININGTYNLIPVKVNNNKVNITFNDWNVIADTVFSGSISSNYKFEVWDNTILENKITSAGDLTLVDGEELSDLNKLLIIKIYKKNSDTLLKEITFMAKKVSSGDILYVGGETQTAYYMSYDYLIGNNTTCYDASSNKFNLKPHNDDAFKKSKTPMGKLVIKLYKDITKEELVEVIDINSRLKLRYEPIVSYTNSEPWEIVSAGTTSITLNNHIKFFDIKNSVEFTTGYSITGDDISSGILTISGNSGTVGNYSATVNVVYGGVNFEVIFNYQIVYKYMHITTNLNTTSEINAQNTLNISDSKVNGISWMSSVYMCDYFYEIVMNGDSRITLSSAILSEPGNFKFELLLTGEEGITKINKNTGEISSAQPNDYIRIKIYYIDTEIGIINLIVNSN